MVNHLKRVKVASVAYYNKSKSLRIADASHPSANLDFLSKEFVSVPVNLSYGNQIHNRAPFCLINGSGADERPEPSNDFEMKQLLCLTIFKQISDVAIILYFSCIFKGKSSIFTHGREGGNAEKHKMQLNLVFSGDMTYKMSENVQKIDKIIR